MLRFAVAVPGSGHSRIIMIVCAHTGGGNVVLRRLVLNAHVMRVLVVLVRSRNRRSIRQDSRKGSVKHAPGCEH